MHVSAEAKAAIGSMLRLQPEKRPSTQQLLQSCEWLNRPPSKAAMAWARGVGAVLTANRMERLAASTTTTTSGMPLRKSVLHQPKLKTVELCRYTQGEYFGELALLSQRPRAATVTAAAATTGLNAQSGGCVVARLDVKAFERLLGPVMNLLQVRYY